MIFPNLILEDVVQVDDKTRLDASKVFVSKDEAAITAVEIEPETGAGFVSVFGSGQSKDWFLDWQYATAGTKTATCRVTTDGSPVTKTFTLEVLSVADDNLFSTDQDIVALEHDIMKWVPAGRASFKNMHRKAQRLILAWLDENGHTDTSGNRLTKEAIVDKEEVRNWSAALTLQLIYQTMSNAIDDVFMQKSKTYESLAITHRKRLILRLDLTGDGEIDTSEGIRVKSVSLVRR